MINTEEIDWSSVKPALIETVKYSDLAEEDRAKFWSSWDRYYKRLLDDIVCSEIKTFAKFYQAHTDKGSVGFIELLTCARETKFYFHELTPDSSSYWDFKRIHQKTPLKMPVVFFDTNATRCFTGCIGKRVFIDTVFSVSGVYDIEDAISKVAQEVKKHHLNQVEKRMEEELYDWLRIKGFNVERQVVTAKHRLDLWIPTKAMLELKQGRVSGDDVCQAIDYAATYQMPIVLVGTGLSTSASRGIDGFNRAMGKDLIVFVTWGGVRPYLSGLL